MTEPEVVTAAHVWAVTLHIQAATADELHDRLLRRLAQGSIDHVESIQKAS